MKYLMTALIFAFLFTACQQPQKTENADGEKKVMTDKKSKSNAVLLQMVKKLPEYKWQHPYKLPELNYEYDALEPTIDELTMKTHHSKHHHGYTNKANKFIDQNNLTEKPVVQIFAEIDQHPVSVRNNGGGFYNHSLFWTFLTPGGSEFTGEVADAIKKEFGAFDDFKSAFEKQAATQFGSGWAWLVMTPEGKLAVTQSSNQDNPLMPVLEVNGIPLLNLDVWEHAYYLEYQNKRTEYISNFWDIVNWKVVNERYLMAKKVTQAL